MEILGGLTFWFLIFVIVLYPNYMFFKKIKDVKRKTIIDKVIYFLTSLILPFLVMISFTTILESYYGYILLNLKIDHNYFIIIYAIVVSPPGYLANIYFAKFYLKRISKTKNEIELIGKE